MYKRHLAKKGRKFSKPKLKIEFANSVARKSPHHADSKFHDIVFFFANSGYKFCHLLSWLLKG